MTAYIDTNIVVDIEQNNISKEQLIQDIDGQIKKFYYSAAHIHEANEITGTQSEKNIRLKKRFETISNVTGNNYIYHELPSNIIHKIAEKPKIVFETINQVSFARGAMKGMMNTVSEDQKNTFREQLNINPIQLNNYTPEQVLEQVNEKKTLFGGYSFISLIEKAVELHPDGKDFGIHNRIAAIFEMLDMIGYWKDKYNEKSNYARLWDSSHAYYSSFCDYFISDDKRTRNKARIAFHIYDIQTKIISSKGEK